MQSPRHTGIDGSGALLLRNVIFGVEDSLVSTVGLLSGIAIESTPRSIVLLTGLVYIFVEAFSMAVGSFLSEESVEEFETHKGALFSLPILGAGAMFVSSVTAGFVPILPYLLAPDGKTGFALSVIVSIAALFLLGLVSGKVSKTGMFSRSLRMGLIGGVAILIGIVVASLVHIS